MGVDRAGGHLGRRHRDIRGGGGHPQRRDIRQAAGHPRPEGAPADLPALRRGGAAPPPRRGGLRRPGPQSRHPRLQVRGRRAQPRGDTLRRPPGGALLRHGTERHRHGGPEGVRHRPVPAPRQALCALRRLQRGVRDALEQPLPGPRGVRAEPDPMGLLRLPAGRLLRHHGVLLRRHHGELRRRHGPRAALPLLGVGLLAVQEPIRDPGGVPGGRQGVQAAGPAPGRTRHRLPALEAHGGLEAGPGVLARPGGDGAGDGRDGGADHDLALDAGGRGEREFFVYAGSGDVHRLNRRAGGHRGRPRPSPRGEMEAPVRPDQSPGRRVPVEQVEGELLRPGHPHLLAGPQRRLPPDPGVRPGPVPHRAGRRGAQLLPRRPPEEHLRGAAGGGERRRW